MFEKLKKIFKKEKKQMADVDKMLEGLSDEEKKELKAKLQDLYKAEDEREIDKVEEEKADDTDVAEEKREEVKEESEEIGKDVDETEDEVEEDEEEESEPTEETDEEEDTDEPDEENSEADEEPQEDNTDKLGEILDRLSKIEAAIEGFNRKPKEADSETADKLSALDRKFN